MIFILTKKSKMNIISLMILMVSICSMEFEAVNGKKKTTVSPNICGKGSTITFPTYISNLKNVSSSDPQFFKKCKKVRDKVGLWILCISGPKYECSILPTTIPITSTTSSPTNTGLTGSLSSTTPPTCPICQTCPTTALPITSTNFLATNTTGPKITESISSTTPPTCPNFPTCPICPTTTVSVTTETEPKCECSTMTSVATTATTPETTTAAATTTTTDSTDSTTTYSTTTDSTTTDSTTTDSTTTYTTPTIAPHCTYNGGSYAVGEFYNAISTTSPLCYPLRCGSDLQMTKVSLSSDCNTTSDFVMTDSGCILKTPDSNTFCKARLNCLQFYNADLWTASSLSSNASYSTINFNQGYAWVGIYGKGSSLYWLNGTDAKAKYIELAINPSYLPSSYDGKCVYGTYGSRFVGLRLGYCSSYLDFVCERLKID